jgi:6-pyruvoyltetrahydropterin/6-carboxytetrahydropterin synthase
MVSKQTIQDIMSFMFRLSVEDHFSAAHQLIKYDGPCENLHGHTFKLLVTVEGEVLDDIGMLVDFHVLKKMVRQIHDEFDHKFLNDILDFSPTSERLAEYVYHKIKPQMPNNVHLVETTIFESDTASATYYE